MTKDLTSCMYVYSSASIEALENLISSFSSVFDVGISIDEMFYYGVLCHPSVYVNFDMWDEVEDTVEVPDILLGSYATPSERLDYVKSIISSYIRGEIQKPAWMTSVECEACVDALGRMPSTFLVLEAKEDKYSDLADALITFLYSPNILTTLAERVG